MANTAKLSAAITLALVLVSTSIFAGNESEERLRQVESEIFPSAMLKGQEPSPQTIQQRMKLYKVPGVSIAIINQGRIEWAKGYGYAEHNSTKMVTSDTIFQAASISKSVSAVAALQLADTGMVDLDRNANDYLKNWFIRPNEWTQKYPVTLRKILSHTAGFNVHGFSGYPAGSPLPTLLQILDGLTPANSQAINVEAVPGTAFRYSGGGYVVMQQLVQDVSGEDLATYANQNVLQRAKMTNSTFTQPLPDPLKEQIAYGHDEDGAVLTNKWHNYPEIGAAGLWTTPTDLAKFALEIQQGVQGQSSLLSKRMTEEYLTPTSFQDYGLGVAIKGEGSGKNFWHTGGNAGFRCILTAYVHEGTGAVIMTNGDGGSFLMKEIQSAIAKAYQWDDYQPRTYEPLANQDPAVLALVQSSVKSLADGKVDAEHFSSEFQKKLTVDILEQYKWIFSDLGATQSMVVIKHETARSSHLYEFWVKFGNAIALLYVTTNDHGQLDSLMIDNVFKIAQ